MVQLPFSSRRRRLCGVGRLFSTFLHAFALLVRFHATGAQTPPAAVGSEDNKAKTPAADIVFIVPDRSTPYANGLHNGILASAFRLDNVTVDVRDYGAYDQALSFQALQAAIDAPTKKQPKVYCIWPMDIESKRLVGKLYEAHGVPIIQINQLPGTDTQWEWDHLLGYAGPEDALRARNAGIMMIDALQGRGIDKPKVVALGYPSSYGGYHLSIAAFREAIMNDPSIEISHDLPLGRTNINQNAYEALVRLMDSGEYFHGVYAMDDNILLGAYEALNDRGRLDGRDAVTLVGTVCNGARELLENGKQYGTTIQAPFLEAALAMDQAVEYINTGKLADKIRFTPNPIATGETWESMVVPFLGQTYAADDLCTWNLYHERTNGLIEASSAQDACDYVDCLFIPRGLFAAGYAMAGINYFLALVAAIMLYIYREKKLIRLAQPFFLGLVIFGAIIDTTSIIFMSRDNSTSTKQELDASCFAWPWLLTLGQMLTTATLVAKIYRVKVVTGAGNSSSTIRRAKVTPKDVSGFIIIGLLVDFIVLAVWYGTDPFKWVISVVSRDFQDLILQARGECSSEGPNAWVYPLVIVILHLALLVYANILAFQTRKFHEISDSKMVAVSLFNSIQLLVLATVMVGLSGDNVAISYLIRVCYAFLNNFGVIALVVLPKLYLCATGRGDTIPSMQRLSSNAGVSRISGLERVSGMDSKSVINISRSRRFSTGSTSKRGSDMSCPEEEGESDKKENEPEVESSEPVMSDRHEQGDAPDQDDFHDNETAA